MERWGWGSILQNSPSYTPKVQPGCVPLHGAQGWFFSPPQTAFICQNIPGRWKLLNSGQQIASDKVLSIPALKSLFSKIQITRSFFSVVFFFIISANKLFSFKWETWRLLMKPSRSSRSLNEPSVRLEGVCIPAKPVFPSALWSALLSDFILIGFSQERKTRMTKRWMLD